MQTKTKSLMQRRIRSYTKMLAEIERFLDSDTNWGQAVDEPTIIINKYWQKA